MSKAKWESKRLGLSDDGTEYLLEEVNAKKLIELTKKLIDNGFSVINFSKANDVVKWFGAMLSAPMQVGIGGSVTVRSLGIPAMLRAMQIDVLDHTTAANKEESHNIQKAILNADAYICSVNAITMAGELFNVDANGNRLAAINFGPKDVYLVVGKNKIVKDYNQALKRLKTVAGPLNSQRLNLPNPCTETGVCSECNSDTRICNTYSLIRRQPWGNRITVMLVDEELGY